MKEKDDLCKSAAALSAVAPSQWTEFLKALSAYTDIIREECIQAPPHMVHVNQGRAQNAVDFVKTLRDAKSVADRIHARPVPRSVVGS